MLMMDQHPHNKSLIISVIGKPNAGKSSLINYFLGQHLAIVSPLPQTTRNHFHCVTTVDRTELVFIDTPGVHFTNQEINLRMNQEAEVAMEGADLVLLLIDSAHKDLVTLAQETMKLVTTMSAQIPLLVVFTKKDISRLDHKLLNNLVTEYISPLLQRDRLAFYWVSTESEENMHQLTGALLDAAKPGPHLYPKGDLSNKSVRFFVSEYIREQVYFLLKEELPYEVAVVIDDFLELDTKKDAREGVLPEKDPIIAKISASILVNRASQRAIVVGASGSIIKEIGIRARGKIEDLLGGKVFLNLHVKVSPKWFKNNLILEQLGLPRAKESHRVWRQK